MDESAKPSIEALLDHAGWVRALARTLVLDANEADDLAQETLTAALSARPAAGHGFKSWLATTLQNVKRQRWRRDVTRERFEALYARDQEHVSSEDLAEQADLQRALVAHVLALDEPYRGVLLQRYFAARSPSEIAAQSGVSIATVTSQLTRAHHQLRKRLERQHGGGMSWLSAVVPLVPRAHVASIAGGILVSMKIALTVAVVVLVGLVVWMSTSRRAATHFSDPARVTQDAALATSRSTAERPVAPTELEKIAPVVREAAPETHSQPHSSPTVDKCFLFGRAVDESDHPLAGVVVRLAAYRVWTEGVDIPRLPGKYDLRGFEMTTGADGAFRFETPVPTAESPWLTLEPDPFHDSARWILGGKRPESKAPLHAGDNDCGMIRLAPTGAIRGSVHDESGAPIADARLVIGPEPTQTLEREGTSDASGHFVVAHSPAGPMGLGAQAEGFLFEFKKPIDVQVGRFTDGVDFVMRKAPTLSGFIVDDVGKPVEGVRLWGLPQSSGHGTVGKSRADGTFTVSLPQDEPYTLEAQREGYEPFGVNDRTTHYAAGTRDLRIVMKRLASSIVSVVDARSNQPLTEFGFEVIPNISDHKPHNTYSEIAMTTPTNHPDGRVAVTFRPGIDVVDIGARGYESQRFDPEAGNPPGGVFVVQLVPTASVSGRVRLRGAPAEGVSLQLESGRMEGVLPDGIVAVHIARRAGESDADGPSTPRFIPDHQGRSVQTSGRDGSFRFEGQPTATYRLTARAPTGEVAGVDTVRVTASSAVDLGTIDLVAGASVRGVVLVPIGRRAAGLVVRVDDVNFGESQVVDVDGRFRFDALVAGAHQLFLPEVPGSIARVPPVDVQLVAGEVRDVRIDARECGTCMVELTILIGGVPAANAQVDLTNGDYRNPIRLGTTDDKGRVSSSVPVAKGVGISVWTQDRIVYEHPSVRLDLTLDAKVVETIRFETGSVVVVIPTSVVMPDKFNARLDLAPTGSSGSGTQDRWVDVVNGVAQNARVTVSDGVHRFQFDDVLAGDWQLVFDMSDAADPREKIQLSANSWQERRKTIFSAQGTVKLVSGQTTTVELH